MSRNITEPREGSREPRRGSIWHLPVSSGAEPVPAERAPGPLVLAEILKEGLPVGDFPEEARRWLLAFGDLQIGTDVSLRLLDQRLDHQSDKEETSLLSLLAHWVPTWFQKVNKAKKDNKTSRTPSLKEQNNLDWLLRYINDFLQLGHASLDATEISRTIDAMLKLCMASSRQSDIDGGISILYTISSNFPFPETALYETLVVLCASAVFLPEMSPHLYDCARLLACGPLHDECMTTFYTFIRLPTPQNNNKNLSWGRGATRLLRILVNENQMDEDLSVVDLKSLLEQLHGAAQHRIFRYCHDILSCLHAALSSEPRRVEAAAQDYNIVMDIIRLCLQTQPPSVGDGSSITSPQLTAQGDSQATERHTRDRDTDTRRLAKDFVVLWDQLDPLAQVAVHDLLLEYPEIAGEDQLVITLQYARDEYLSSNDNSIRRRYTDDIYHKIVQNHALPSSCRLKGMEVLVQAGNASSNGPSAMNDDQHANYVWILDRLLDQISEEHDIRVLETLLKSLDYMASNYHEAAKEPSYSIRAVVKLRALIVGGYSTLEFSDDQAVLATKVLVTIFSHTIHTSAEAAVQAYNALLAVANGMCKSRPACLIAKRLLFRIRADDGGFIYITSVPESVKIASALVRTQDSLDTFNLESNSSQRKSASSSTLSTKDSNSSPLWRYPETEDVTFPFADQVSGVLNVSKEAHPGVKAEIDIDSWLMCITHCLQSDQDWETYSYTVVHAGAQLNNIALCLNSLQTVVKLRQVLCEHVVNNSFREPPTPTGLKKSDVVLCLYDVLVALVPYATMRSEDIQKGFGTDLVRAFLAGIGGPWEGASRACIHALSLCSLEIPASVATLYPTIVDKMAKNMAQAHLATHILEFLIQVALLPEMHSNLNPDEVQIIFGICIQYLERSREQQQTSVTSPPGRMNAVSRHSGMNFRRPPYRSSMLTDTGVPQYAAALAYHNILFWFLALPLELRARYVHWIVPRLVWKNSRGEETVDEQSQVLIDMMQRTAFSDLGETSPRHDFADIDEGEILSSSWIAGLSIITTETAGSSGKTLLTKRQASGTTYAMYQQLTVEEPSHQRPSHTQIRRDKTTTAMLPPHIMLQLGASAATTSLADQPLLLPDEDFVKRALEGFDRVPTVTSHKIGVLYIAPGQSAEGEFLANSTASPDFERLLQGLGYEVSLEPPLRFKPQGLQYPDDGESTIAWRDRVEEIIYFVPTMMPTNLEDDPQCIAKKRHVGNCHVNVVFNRSGIQWQFENVRSQLNYVNVVIQPACRSRQKEAPDFLPGFYRVQVVTRDDMPSISPAADTKIISADQLAVFVRTLALNADIFCATWNTKDDDVEFPSGWRARLQQIKMLKERVMTKAAEKQVSTTGNSTVSALTGAPSGRRTPVPREEPAGSRRDSVLAAQLDFSAWTA